MQAIVDRPSSRPSFCTMSTLALSVLWFGLIVGFLVGIRDVDVNSIFVAFVSSLMFLMAANAVVRGTISSCRY